MRLVLHTSLVFLLWMANANAETWVWKTEPFAENCSEYDGPKLDKDGNILDGEHDFILHKCLTKFGPTMWLLYQDSARVSIGFGSRANTVWTGAILNRGDWPIEWGGIMSAGIFYPRSVTVRFNSWDGDQTTRSILYVYKLAGDEPACIVAGVVQNDEARQIASGIDVNAKCDRDAEIR